jgi:hypothetical protein
MKHDDAHDEIGAMLRSHKPPLEESPDLEARILRELDRRQRPTPARPWLWFALPTAFAAIVVAMWPQARTPKTGGPGAGPSATTRESIPEPEKPSSIVDDNPLKQESLALSRDARRAGRFLIDCMPSPGK